ncbi:MAG: hypothetical protein ACPGVB_13750, partial [Chitinophagales bacterium]
ICTVQVNVENTDLQQGLVYGIYRHPESNYDILGEVNYTNIKLMFNRGKGTRRMEYKSAKDNTIIAPTKKGQRDLFQAVVKFGIYGLGFKEGIPNSQAPNTYLPEDELFLVQPQNKDTSFQVANLLKDVIEKEQTLFLKMGFKDPYLLILKEKTSERKKGSWENYTSGEAYDYFFILWDKGSAPDLPPITKLDRFETYELIKLNQPKREDETHKVFYVDISDLKDRKKLYKALKKDLKAVKDDNLNFNLFISNGSEPYKANGDNYKKVLKYIRTTETEPPLTNQDITFLKEIFEDNKVFDTVGKVGIHLYLSDLFYETSTMGDGKIGEERVRFIDKLMKNKSCDKANIYIHLEKEQDIHTYKCDK